MVASTVFFATEAQTVGAHWKTSLHVGLLVTMLAAVLYLVMRKYWGTIKQTPTVYRFIDWSLTVPLQMIESSYILKAVKPVLVQAEDGAEPDKTDEQVATSDSESEFEYAAALSAREALLPLQMNEPDKTDEQVAASDSESEFEYAAALSAWVALMEPYRSGRELSRRSKTRTTTLRPSPIFFRSGF